MNTGLRILLAEDDPDLLLVMTHELTLAGHRITVAETADETIARAGDVDLVLLDFHLPGADGLEVLSRIQQLRSPPSVVMVTGDDLSGLDEKAIHAGAVDFVPKRPGYLRALPGIVQRAARQHDLFLRINDLEAVSMALLGAESLAEAQTEIVHGAVRMLRAEGGALIRIDASSPEVIQGPFAQLGSWQSLVAAVSAMPAAELPSAGIVMNVGDDGLVARLSDGINSEGWALVIAGLGTEATADERGLARAFARVAAKALQSVGHRAHQREVLEALHSTLDVRVRIHDRALEKVSEQLDRASTELGELLDGGESDPVVVRRVARAEAHVSAAKDAVMDLVRGNPEG